MHASAQHGARPPFPPQVRGPLLLEIPVPRRDRFQSAETGGAAGAAGVVVGATGVDAGAAMDSGGVVGATTAAGSGGVADGAAVAVSIAGSAPAGLMGTEARLPKMAAEARLLAVDLGLRMGLALFNGEGRLLQYAYRRVESAVELGDLAEGVLSGQSLIWQPGELDRARDLAEGARDLAGGGLVPNMAPESAGAAPDTARSQSTAIPVTHVAIEGRDLDLRREWEAAAARVAARRGGGGGGGGGGPAARVREVSLIATDCVRLRPIAPDAPKLRPSSGEPRGVA